MLPGAGLKPATFGSTQLSGFPTPPNINPSIPIDAVFYFIPRMTYTRIHRWYTL